MPNPDGSFVDKRWREFHPDPSGRFSHRAVVKGKWTATVLRAGSKKSLEDPDGVALCAGVPVPGWAGEQAAAEASRSAAELEARPGAVRWEYKVLSATFGTSLEGELNKEGQLGWEVVSISAASGTMTLTGNKIFALMKRPAPAT